MSPLLDDDGGGDDDDDDDDIGADRKEAFQHLSCRPLSLMGSATRAPLVFFCFVFCRGSLNSRVFLPFARLDWINSILNRAELAGPAQCTNKVCVPGILFAHTARAARCGDSRKAPAAWGGEKSGAVKA